MRQLPDGSVDAIITDPPYSSGGLTHSARSQDPSKKYVQTQTKIVRPSFPGDCRDARSWLHWCILWMAECYRVLKDGGYMLVFSDWRQMPLATDAIQFGNIIWRGIVPWDKTEGARAPHKGYFRHQCEYIIWGTKGACHPNTEGPFPGCFRFPVLQADKYHMTGKPTPLLEQLVRIVPPDGVILDPFAGSGTTAVAAIHMGRQYICIEVEPEYVQIARDRVDQATRQAG